MNNPQPNIFPTNIIGPIHSRRLGVSLGVNLLPKDGKILKLDGAFDETIHLIDQPGDPHYAVRQVVDGLKSFPLVGGTDGHRQLIVQTMFVRGDHDGHIIDNTTPAEVAAWCELMREVRPRQIMVYSLDRPTPEQRLTAVSKAEMEQFVAPLVAEGFDVQVSGK